ncbi:MAG: hypothetical protein ACRERV_04940 [Methylococcales bacterium]
MRKPQWIKKTVETMQNHLSQKMKWSLATWLVPEELISSILALSLVISGLLMMVGLRKAAMALIVFVLVTAFLPVFDPVIEELVAVLPDWVLILSLVAFVFMALKALTAWLFGEKASNQAWANVFVNAIVFVLRLPFKILWWLVRLPFR